MKTFKQIFPMLLALLILAVLAGCTVSSNAPTLIPTTIQENKSPNVIAGFYGNQAAEGVQGATINGGGGLAFPNQVSRDFGTIGGGLGNLAGERAVVGGGTYNTASGFRSTVGGGSNNLASSNYATVGGGTNNNAGAYRATVAGGADNTASEMDATVGGGSGNVAGFRRATVAGGTSNTANNVESTVGGGSYNTASGRMPRPGAAPATLPLVSALQLQAGPATWPTAAMPPSRVGYPIRQGANRPRCQAGMPIKPWLITASRPDHGLTSIQRTPAPCCSLTPAVFPLSRWPPTNLRYEPAAAYAS
jgi:hypothetical protein